MHRFLLRRDVRVQLLGPQEEGQLGAVREQERAVAFLACTLRWHEVMQCIINNEASHSVDAQAGVISRIYSLPVWPRRGWATVGAASAAPASRAGPPS